MNKIKAIGLCGLARCGKDTFFSIVKEYFSNKGYQPYRLSFADILKEDVNEFLWEKTGINAFTEDPIEKELIRDFLVAYGTKLMRRIDENYWISKVEQNLRPAPPFGEMPSPLPVFTDVRYLNELKWIKSLGGSIIHIEREGILPPNEEEIKNDPLLKKIANINFYWENFSDGTPSAFHVSEVERELKSLNEDNQRTKTRSLYVG